MEWSIYISRLIVSSTTPDEVNLLVAEGAS